MSFDENSKKPNSKNGSGPKSEAGKKRSRQNARKEGFFAKELNLKEDERPQFDAWRAALQSQLGPATPMQQIGFELILYCIRRMPLALRREMRRLRDPDGLMQQDRSPEEGAKEAGPPHWYGSGRAELQAATRMLARLRREIETNNFHHPDEWKEPLTKTFGDQFYQLFSNWSPQDFEVELLARQLRAHARNFEMPLPESLQASNNTPTVGDSGSQQQMLLKLVDLALQQVDDIRRIIDERSSAGDSQRFASAEDGNYFSRACRDLERSVRWYKELVELGL